MAESGTRRMGTLPLSLARTPASLDAQERRENVVRMLGGVKLGALLWVLTMSLDWVSTTYVEPRALGYFFVIRAIGLVNLLIVVAILSRPTLPSARLFSFLQHQTYVGTSALVALLAIRTGGVESVYACTLAAIMAVQAISQPVAAGVSAPRMVLTMLGYIGTLLVSASWDERVRAQFHEPRSLALFGTILALDVVAGALLVTGGHAIYALRREVFEARELGRYRLRRQIGKGGMGEVWLASHPALKADVAVKIVRGLDAPDVTAARFQREIRALTELRHPNTVRVFDCGVSDGGVLYYVMELLDGATLAEIVVADGPLPPARAVHLIRQAARALAEAHFVGIVHRDLKPENLFITSQGGERDFVKLLDFGIAKLQKSDEPNATLTREGHVMGTPAFMAPEQVEAGDVDFRADIYGLGAVLYYALVGRIPFEAPTAMAIMMAHVTHAPPAPSARSPHLLSPMVDAVVLRCMAKDPKARYASMLELDAALAACDVTTPLLDTLAFANTSDSMPSDVGKTIVDLPGGLADEATKTELTRVKKVQQ